MMLNNRITRRVYAIRDDRQKEFNPPVLIANDAVASRSFGDMLLGEKQTTMSLHPADFSLWYLCDMDTESGEFLFAGSDKSPYLVARATDFVGNKKAE